MERLDIEELCKKHNIKIKSKQLNVINGKNFLNITVDEWKEIYKKRGNMQRSSLEIDMKIYSDLYEVCKAEGYASYSPFDSIELSSENLFYYINEGIYISPKDLDDALSFIKNEDYWNCIIGLLYEGATDKNEIYNLTNDRIDLINGKIYFDSHTLEMSKRLKSAILLYNELKIYERTNISGRHKTEKTIEYKLYNAHPEGFVKVCKNPKTNDEYTQFINMLTNTLMNIGFTKSRLYFSGLVNYIYRKCDYSADLLEQLFFEDNRSNPKNTSKIEIWAKEYGLKSKDLVSLRYRYGIFVRDFLDRL